MSTKVPQKNRPRLGRGLSSLLSVSTLPVHAETATAPAHQPSESGSASSPASGGVVAGQTEAIPVALIRPNPHQPRRDFNESSLAELAASIKSTGLIQPVVVRKASGGYELIAGERRLRAARMAGLTEIPALLREVDGVTQAQMALVENIQREDLNPIDRAKGYRTLLDQLGLTQAELAGRLGEDRSSIANFLRLLELAEPVRAMLRDGRLAMGHAKLLAGVADVLEQERLANLVTAQGLSVRNLERIVQQGGRPAVVPAAAPSAHIQDLEKSIARQLGMRVQVRATGKKGRGRLVIHYSNLDQFDHLLHKLGVATE